MQMDAGALPYPMPWAATAAASFAETPETYRKLPAKVPRRAGTQPPRLRPGIGGAVRARTSPSAAPRLGPPHPWGPAGKGAPRQCDGDLDRSAIAPIEIIAEAI